MSNMQRRAARIVFVMGLIAGCGGDDGSAGVSTGLPTQQKLSTLDDDEVKQACRSVSDAAMMVITPSAIQRASCLSLGVQAGLNGSGSEAKVDVAKCQQAVDTCVSSAGKETKDNYECDSASANDVQGCEATVGEYETCFNSFLNLLQQRLTQLTCQNAEKLSGSAYEQDVDASSIPDCQNLMTKCPDAELGLPLSD
jgi:hypothetical protein